MNLALYLVLVPIREEVVPAFFREIVEAEHLVALEPRTLHHAIRFEFIGSDDSAAVGADMSDDAHD